MVRHPQDAIPTGLRRRAATLGCYLCVVFGQLSAKVCHYRQMGLVRAGEAVRTFGAPGNGLDFVGLAPPCDGKPLSARLYEVVSRTSGSGCDGALCAAG
jgi:hypothetical protein